MDSEKRIVIDDIVLNHYPDSNKSRGSYLPLLELSVEEDPLDDRNMHYLGREYMFYHRWEDCINTLNRHLQLDSATWNLERAASMRYIARSYYNLGNIEETKKYYLMSISEASNMREGYVELAFFYYNQGEWLDCINNLIKALIIKSKPMVYVNEIFCWDSTIDDLLSVCYYNLALYDLALFHVEKAIVINNNDERLLNNKKIIEEKLNK